MIRALLGLVLVAASVPAISQDWKTQDWKTQDWKTQDWKTQDWKSAHAIDTGSGSLPVLTVVVDPACAPCLRAYTEIVSRVAVSDPALANRPIRWIVAASDEAGIGVAARALERRSIDAFSAPASGVDEALSQHSFYIEQARNNARLLRMAGRSPLFFLPNRPTKAGYTNWTDFASWLLP
jgi:hypothetical protein